MTNDQGKAGDAGPFVIRHLAIAENIETLKGELRRRSSGGPRRLG